MKVVATTTTKEGVTIVSQQIGKCYEKGDEDFVSWSFKGEPAGVQFQMNSPPTVQMTSTATISRISQIIAAVPGYVTTDKLPIAKYRHY
jgi:4-hydroxy-tetrahydrodipicolinate reductase